MHAERDADTFEKLLQSVGEFYDVTVSPAKITIFFGALIEFEYEIVRLAFSRYLSSPQARYGFPKPVDIREIIEGSQTEREANAWNSINEAIRRVGIYQSIVIEDPCVGEAITRVFGSWVACCATARESTPYLWDSKRREFVTAYRWAQRIERKDKTAVLLSGYCESQNRETGRFPSAQPYGVILIDGRVEMRHLDIDVRTGLPAVAVTDIPRLPPSNRAELPAAVLDDVGGELVPRDAVITLEAAFKRLIQERGFPSGPTPIPDVDPDAERRAELQRQAAQIVEAEASHGATETLRAAKAASPGDTDRLADHGGRTASGGKGIPVRKKHRSKLGGGSRVAGVSHSVRDRGRVIRQRDTRGHGNMDHAPKKGRGRR